MPVKHAPGVLDQTLRAYEECGGNARQAAFKLGWPESTFNTRLRRAQTALIPSAPIIQVDTVKEELIERLRARNEELEKQLAQAIRPHFTVRSDFAGRSSKIRLVCVGDAHSNKQLLPDQSRFALAGAYVRDTKPDVLVQIGDMADLDSLNTHVPNETYAGKAKPSFMDDMIGLNEALELFDCGGVEKHCTLGNHERRLYLFEDRAPEAYGMMQFELQRLLEKHKWTYSPYGQITYYGGVGFVHAALNRLGKTYGGKNAEPTIANDSIHDLVIGHSHTDRKHRAPKIGGNNEVQIVNVGCFLPNGFIFPYAQHSTTGWSYGLADMVIQHGKIQDYSFVSMARLEEQYGKKAA